LDADFSGRNGRSNYDHAHPTATSAARRSYPLVSALTQALRSERRLSFAGSNARANYFRGAAACPRWVKTGKAQKAPIAVIACAVFGCFDDKARRPFFVAQWSPLTNGLQQAVRHQLANRRSERR
jgi:hypothetical protein